MSNINLLLVISYANIFSHSVGCLFVLLKISLFLLLYPLLLNISQILKKDFEKILL